MSAYTKVDALVRAITQKIEGGEWPPGYQLPRDEDLRVQYGVSQMTIRTAMERLRPLVVSVPGKGRFVAEPSGPNDEPGGSTTGPRPG